MRSNEAVRAMMSATRTTQLELAKMLGSNWGSNSRVSSMLKADLRAQTLARVANLLGYKLILVSNSSGETIELTYEEAEK